MKYISAQTNKNAQVISIYRVKKVSLDNEKTSRYEKSLT